MRAIHSSYRGATPPNASPGCWTPGNTRAAGSLSAPPRRSANCSPNGSGTSAATSRTGSAGCCCPACRASAARRSRRRPGASRRCWPTPKSARRCWTNTGSFWPRTRQTATSCASTTIRPVKSSRRSKASSCRGCSFTRTQSFCRARRSSSLRTKSTSCYAPAATFLAANGAFFAISPGNTQPRTRQTS